MAIDAAVSTLSLASTACIDTEDDSGDTKEENAPIVAAGEDADAALDEGDAMRACVAGRRVVLASNSTLKYLLSTDIICR